MRKILLITALATMLFAENLAKMAFEAGVVPIPTDPKELRALIERADNPLTDAKIELGKKLFFDPRLSLSGIISCATCHNLGLGGADLIAVATGHKWAQNGSGLNTPTVYNSAFYTAQFLDGRSPHLADQAKGPMTDPNEMAIDPITAQKRISSIPAYAKMFKEAFRSDESDEVTFDNIAKAIAAFESTLITPSRFDDFLHGKERALTKDEKKGLKIFLTKGCTNCHNGVSIGGQSMQLFPAQGFFRYAHIGNFSGDEFGRVRVPTLRNITLTAPYFHNGTVWDLTEAITIMGEAQLTQFVTPEEAKYIALFFGSLEGRKPQIIYPQLPASVLDTPKPITK